MPSSVKFCDPVTYAVRVFLLGLFCGSFQFVPQSSVVVLASFAVDTVTFLVLHNTSSNIFHSYVFHK